MSKAGILVLEGLGLPVLLRLPVASFGVSQEGVLTDLLVSLLIELFKAVGFDLVVDVALELRLVALLIILLLSS